MLNKFLITALISCGSVVAGFSMQGDGRGEADQVPMPVVAANQAQEAVRDWMQVIPQDVTKLIFQNAAEQGTNPRTFRLVSKRWAEIIDQGNKTDDQGNVRYSTIGPVWKSLTHAYYGVLGNEEVFEQFLNGKLIYRPNQGRDEDQGSDEGMIVLNIRDLANPFQGTFDLSLCGNAGQYLSINTGFRRGVRKENTDKGEIWICPQFIINQMLSTTAAHFTNIMTSWDGSNAPIGIFYTCGEDTNLLWFDYLITACPLRLRSNTLAYRLTPPPQPPITGFIHIYPNMAFEPGWHFMFIL